MAYEPVLTTYTDPAPAPRVEVLFNTFAPSTAFVTVYRLSGGREYKVRDAVLAATAGALSRIDHEVPFGQASAYRAEMFDAAKNSLGFTGTTTLTLNVSQTWVHNPLDPAGAVMVEMLDTAARSISKPLDGTVFYPSGRKVGVVISGQRRGVSGVRLDCATHTDSDADKFARLVGDYGTTTVPVLCFRFSAALKIRLPRPFFSAVLDPRERDVDLRYGGSEIDWDLTGDEVSPPAAGIIIPLLRRKDINAAFATNAAIAAGNLTRLAVNRRYDLGGTAP